MYHHGSSNYNKIWPYYTSCSCCSFCGVSLLLMGCISLVFALIGSSFFNAFQSNVRDHPFFDEEQQQAAESSFDTAMIIPIILMSLGLIFLVVGIVTGCRLRTKLKEIREEQREQMAAAGAAGPVVTGYAPTPTPNIYPMAPMDQPPPPAQPLSVPQPQQPPAYNHVYPSLNTDGIPTKGTGNSEYVL